MIKKLFIVFSSLFGFSLILTITCIVLLFSTGNSLGNQTNFWNKNEGKYELYYNVEESTGSSMIQTYFGKEVIVEFNEDNVVLYFTMYYDYAEESILYFEDKFQYKECLKEEYNNNTLFSYTIVKSELTTDLLNLKVKIGAMPIEPEFSITLLFDTAYLIEA